MRFIFFFIANCRIFNEDHVPERNRQRRSDDFRRKVSDGASDDDEDRDGDSGRPVVVVRKSVSRRNASGRQFPEPRDSRQARVGIDSNSGDGTESSSIESSSMKYGLNSGSFSPLNPRARQYSAPKTLPINRDYDVTRSDDIADLGVGKTSSRSNSTIASARSYEADIGDWDRTRDRERNHENGQRTANNAASSSAWATKARSIPSEDPSSNGTARQSDNGWNAAKKTEARPSPNVDMDNNKGGYLSIERVTLNEGTEMNTDDYQTTRHQRSTTRDSTEVVDDGNDDDDEANGIMDSNNYRGDVYRTKGNASSSLTGYQSRAEYERAAAEPGALAKDSYQQFSDFLKKEQMKGHYLPKERGNPEIRLTSDPIIPASAAGATENTPESMSRSMQMERAYGWDMDSTENKLSAVVFGMRAHPHGHNSDLVQCTIFRDRSNFQNRLYPVYEMWLEEPSMKILVAMKMNMNRTSNYHIFDMTRGVAGTTFSKKSGNYLGKLRALNTQGTEYVLLTHNSEREEIAAVYFERTTIVNTLMEGSQPRKMTVAVPHVDSKKVPIPHRIRDAGGSGSLVDILREGTHTNRVLCYENKQPVYENGNYRLNFRGRVSQPSVKNFQLVSPDAIDNVVCQFGKVGEDQYTVDYKAPINAVQALCFALCQFNV